MNQNLNESWWEAHEFIVTLFRRVGSTVSVLLAFLAGDVRVVLLMFEVPDVASKHRLYHHHQN